MENGMKEQVLDQAELLAQMFPKDSIEYKLLLRYTQKQIAANSQPPQNHGVGEATVSPIQPQDHNKRKKSKKHKWLKMISCIRPMKEDDSPTTTHNERRAAALPSSSDQGEVEQMVDKLTQISGSVCFMQTEIESDGDDDGEDKDDDIVRRLVELLREHGDKLNKEIEKDNKLQKQLQGCLSYSFFKQVAWNFMQTLTPEELSTCTAQSTEQAKIALTCELTSRLNTLDCHPMNRVLGFGAKFLQDYFTPWVLQQGGYEKVFGTDSDAEGEVE